MFDDVKEAETDLLRKHERTGRPLGKDSFIETMESLLNPRLKPQKPGPKRKDEQSVLRTKGILRK